MRFRESWSSKLASEQMMRRHHYYHQNLGSLLDRRTGSWNGLFICRELAVIYTLACIWWAFVVLPEMIADVETLKKDWWICHRTTYYGSQGRGGHASHFSNIYLFALFSFSITVCWKFMERSQICWRKLMESHRILGNIRSQWLCMVEQLLYHAWIS